MRNKKSLISIVITYYKKKKFIKKTIRSILNQNYKNYEVIFVYDDYDIKELNYIKNILRPIKKKKIINNLKNLGVAKSRNIAIKHCKGDFITFIDSDDIWKNNKLYDQHQFMIKKSFLFSFTSYNVIDEKDRLIKKRKVKVVADYKNLSKSNFIGLSTVMLHKKILKRIVFPNLKTQEDLGLWLKLCRQGIKLNHLNKPLTLWRKTSNSLSSNTFRKLRDAFLLFYIYENKNFINSIYSVITLSYNKILKELR